MDVKSLQITVLLILMLHEVKITNSVVWENIRCSSDSEQSLSDGTVMDIGRFPWLGVVQHNFYAAGKMRFAIAAAVLIHPAYAIAPAEDMARIRPDQLQNSTKLILWRSSSVKYALDVTDYVLHPEYEERGTLATLALLELYTTGETGVGENSDPALPVCLPASGGGTFSGLYTVKMTDENKELQKEAYKMAYMEDKDCDEFYHKHKLMYKKMIPSISICAKTERAMPTCIWDGGAALVTQQSWGYWRLVGFSVRGAGCGAPARFLNVIDYMPWINDMLTQRPIERVADVHRLGVRRLSPVAVVLYTADKIFNTEQGQCNPHLRGHVLYKEQFEVIANKNFAQGFFYIVINQLMEFNCAIVKMENVAARSNAAVWLEHYCHREITGQSPQIKPRDYRKMDCFLYFKSAAFVHFRFQFSFKANVEMTLYGSEEIPRRMPNPFDANRVATTDKWWPTNTKMDYAEFYPYALWYWEL